MNGDGAEARRHQEWWSMIRRVVEGKRRLETWAHHDLGVFLRAPSSHCVVNEL